MQNMLDLSHLRSLTVFGQWRSFFISDKMRFLRVLDLEHTIGLRDHHLDKIVKLFHLRYLSLRGCINIVTLPDSFANLRQLQTLDIRGTHIWTLPTAVTSLQNLQYIHAFGSSSERDIVYVYMNLMDGSRVEDDIVFAEHLPWCCLVINGLRYMGHFFWRPRVLEDGWRATRQHVAEGVNRHDIISLCRSWVRLRNGDGWYQQGVLIPKGISRLKALHTLRGVKVGHGKTTIQELRELTQLRKLGVTYVNDKNSNEFWRAIAGHDRLQSLLVSSGHFYEDWTKEVGIDCCLGESLSPPKSLVSLNLSAKLVMVPEWIHRLQNLSKLELAWTRLNQDATDAIGMLPNLAVLRLRHQSLLGEKFRFQRSSFPSLLVLDLHSVNNPFNEYPESLEFEQEAMPKLEVLQAYQCWGLREISGLQFLTSLKEVRVDGDLKELVQRKHTEYPNTVISKLK